MEPKKPEKPLIPDRQPKQRRETTRVNTWPVRFRMGSEDSKSPNVATGAGRFEGTEVPNCCVEGVILISEFMEVQASATCSRSAGDKCGNVCSYAARHDSKTLMTWRALESMLSTRRTKVTNYIWYGSKVTVPGWIESASETLEVSRPSNKLGTHN